MKTLKKHWKSTEKNQNLWQFALSSSHISGEEKRGGALIGGGAINGENTVIKKKCTVDLRTNEHHLLL